MAAAVLQLLRSERRGRSKLRPAELKAGRHNPDHGVGLAVQRDRLIENVRIAAEAALPESITEHHDPVVTRLIVVLNKRSSVKRVDTKHGKEPRCHSRSREPLGFGAAAVVVGRAPDRCDFFEYLVLVTPVDEVRRRHRELRPAFLEVVLAHDNQPIRIRERQRAKQNRIDGAEHRAVRSDAERQSCNCNQRETRKSEQHSDGISKVLKQVCCHPFFLSFFISSMTDSSHVSEVIGSTRVARRAGMKHASNATPASNNDKAANVIGSVASTPNNRDSISRVKASAPANPTAIAITIRRIPYPMTIPRIVCRSAPSATRIPSSRVRSETE